MGRRGLLLGGLGLGGLSAAALLRWRARPPALAPEDMARRHATPLPPPDGPLATYHLGHSLVGRDMPAMLAQMAGHDHAFQLGWGASLKQHWEGDVPGFETENAPPPPPPRAAGPRKRRLSRGRADRDGGTSRRHPLA